ncbi:phage major capsid protein, HK97 family [Erwinia tracheiphila PSU-1]|nr:phage major capsid protein, HK97 family [Erwinia tracheiphila PSU-1]
MKKLPELRQEKNALKTQMRSIMDKATEEKRDLNADEGNRPLTLMTLPGSNGRPKRNSWPNGAICTPPTGTILSCTASITPCTAKQ